MRPSYAAKAVPAVTEHDLRNIEQLAGELNAENTDFRIHLQAKRLATKCRISLTHATLVASLAFRSGVDHA